MNLIDDFFILIWGEKFIGKEVHLTKRDEDFLEFASIILSVNLNNYEKYFALQSFKDMCLKFGKNEPKNVKDIKNLQNSLLLSLSLKNLPTIKANLNLLENEKIISHKEEQKIVSLLELILQDEEEQETQKKEIKSYQDSVSFFENIIKDLSKISTQQSFLKNLEKLKNQLKNQTFSIGITGVLNAGKSTMLNALLGKEVLGTSNIPETANLSILKYGKNSQCKVNFWNNQEWEEIEKSASQLAQMQKFVNDTKSYFKGDLSEFIQNETKSIQTDTTNLHSYTSAKNPTCNLVKSVELYEDLEFLKNGVEIVDTPGLDDPVVQREEITKYYLCNCDVLIHLMNVNQSATQKDIDFIIHSLTYGHITRLLIVLTRIDTISENELKEVEEYTKNSIKNRLIELNNEAKFNSILQKIEFLPIAGKMALLHRIGKQNDALKAGYDLDKTGILKLEGYLADVLFGSDNEKNKLLIKSLYTQISSLTKAQKELISYEFESLNKDDSTLKAEFEKTKNLNSKNLKDIELLEQKISGIKQNLENYLITLNNLLQTKLLNLKTILTQRIYDDVSYELRKNSKKPKTSRLNVIIETTVKDGIVDILRDYRYEFEKRMQKEMEQVSNTQLMNQNFNSKEFFDTNFKGSFLSKNYDLTQSKVANALNKTKKSTLDEFAVSLDEIFKDTIEGVSKSIFDSLNELNKNLINNFLELSSKPLNELKANMQEKENILLSHIDLLKLDEKKVKIKKIQLQKSLKQIEKIQKELMENENELIK